MKSTYITILKYLFFTEDSVFLFPEYMIEEIEGVSVFSDLSLLLTLL